ncbi:MAG TPA: hypothetical protein VL501_02205 [Pyrinomonadaceae bacterium]|nr:hypothetical protein [Pyrinomonadaceae bacterium]
MAADQRWPLFDDVLDPRIDELRGDFEPPLILDKPLFDLPPLIPKFETECALPLLMIRSLRYRFWTNVKNLMTLNCAY